MAKPKYRAEQKMATGKCDVCPPLLPQMCLETFPELTVRGEFSAANHGSHQSKTRQHHGIILRFRHDVNLDHAVHIASGMLDVHIRNVVIELVEIQARRLGVDS